ncbi:MAG: hypothetical protein ACK5LX_04870 [Oscillospiraceae bacterium]
MRKKTAIFLTIFYVAITLADIVVTRVGTPDLGDEANPLVQLLLRLTGSYVVAWIGLILSNLLVMAVYLVPLWYSMVYYRRPAPFEADGFRDYLKKLDKEKGEFRVFVAMLGFAMGFSLPIARIVPVLEWLTIFATGGLPYAYNRVRNAFPMGRPDICLAALLLLVLAMVWYRMEFTANRRAWAALTKAEQADEEQETPEEEAVGDGAAQ